VAAYIIVDVEIKDPVRYQEYIKQTPPTLEPFGGRFIVRGGRAANLEGRWQPKRIVVLEFDSAEQATAWWSSDVYRGAKALRQSAAVTDMIVVEGV
jgi:uncharacterized protein (DUF1330 family)